jgi:hypothetical protein
MRLSILLSILSLVLFRMLGLEIAVVNALDGRTHTGYYLCLLVAH